MALETTMSEQTTWQSLRTLAIRCRRSENGAGAIAYLEQAIESTKALPDLAAETGSMLNYLADL
jgi:hypothetical protein